MKSAQQFFESRKRDNLTHADYMDFAELYADYVVGYEKLFNNPLTRLICSNTLVNRHYNEEATDPLSPAMRAALNKAKATAR